MRRLKNSDIVSLLTEREIFAPSFFYHLLAKKISKAVSKYYKKRLQVHRDRYPVKEFYKKSDNYIEILCII